MTWEFGEDLIFKELFNITMANLDLPYSYYMWCYTVIWVLDQVLINRPKATVIAIGNSAILFP